MDERTAAMGLFADFGAEKALVGQPFGGVELEGVVFPIRSGEAGQAGGLRGGFMKDRRLEICR